MVHFSTMALPIFLVTAFAAPGSSPNADMLAKRTDGTCTIVKDSLWHYTIDIPGDGHDGCGGGLLDNIRGTGYQPQDWGTTYSGSTCIATFALPAGSSDAVNRGFQAAYGGTAGC